MTTIPTIPSVSSTVPRGMPSGGAAAPPSGFDMAVSRAVPEPTAPAAKAAIAFEAVVLRTLVEAMLPENGFGSGTAGHMWRGQMADALADAVAKAGGVGIAEHVE